ncbi:MAG: HAMP domain-containing sensor histidine kinase [Actinomycetota bacterium]
MSAGRLQTRLIGVLAAGAVLALIACRAYGVPAHDAGELIAYAAAGAVLSAVAGAAVVRLTRRRGMALQLTISVVTAVGSVAIGVMLAADKMFISKHDLRALAVVVIAAGAVGLCVALVLGDRVSSSTRALAELAQAIGAGTESPTLRTDVPREFVTLGRELQSMAARLDDSRVRERALESARRELVAWVSHDLRTPLAGIRAMAEALEDGVVADQESVARYHRQLRKEADRLTGMVDDLFELSRINAGALRLQMERVALGDLVSDAIAAADPLAHAKGVKLRGEVTGAPAVAVSVPEVSRVLRNLLHNAIRHTPSDGSIHVESGMDEEYGFVAVHDSCGGIPAADLDRVFDPAFRGEAARTPTDDGGGGLGLAIARGLVEAHSGDISVANSGAGCRFVVRLPLVDTTR